MATVGIKLIVLILYHQQSQLKRLNRLTILTDLFLDQVPHDQRSSTQSQTDKRNLTGPVDMFVFYLFVTLFVALSHVMSTKKIFDRLVKCLKKMVSCSH